MTHRVVVLGAGYAGLVTAIRVARQVHADEVSVTLVTAFPNFVERPRLHQIATGQKITTSPITRYLRNTGVRLIIGSVTGIDLDAHTVTIFGREPEPIGYDTLVYGLGSNIDVSQVPGIAAHADSLVGTAAAARVRSRLHDIAKREGRVIVCGGGLTGIEIATEVAEYSPLLDVTLVSGHEPGDWLSPKARRYIARTFNQLGVTVRTGARVREVQAGHVALNNGAQVPFDMCLWAGGFRVPTLAQQSGLAVNKEDRALVNSNLESISHEGVFVVGDAAAVPGPWGKELAMGCRSGGFTGPKAADNIVAKLTGQTPEPFQYRYLHECISLGRQHGLVQFLHADESPTSHILTGRKAIVYKNAVLNGAKMLFANPGPVIPRRRHVAGTARSLADSASQVAHKIN